MCVYGSQLWNFDSSLCEQFYVTWRKCIRRLLSLPPRTHCNLLNLICDDSPVDIQLHSRFMNFIKSCLNDNSDNECVHICIQHVLHGSKSNVCNSLTLMCSKYMIDRFADNFKTVNIQQQVLRYSDVNSVQKAATIRDFIDLKRFHNNDHSLDEIITYLCVD